MADPANLFRSEIQALPLEEWEIPWGSEDKRQPHTYVVFLGHHSVYLAPTYEANVYAENDLTSAEHRATLRGSDIETLYKKVASFHAEKFLSRVRNSPPDAWESRGGIPPAYRMGERGRYLSIGDRFRDELHVCIESDISSDIRVATFNSPELEAEYLRIDRYHRGDALATSCLPAPPKNPPAPSKRTLLQLLGFR